METLCVKRNETLPDIPTFDNIFVIMYFKSIIHSDDIMSDFIESTIGNYFYIKKVQNKRLQNIYVSPSGLSMSIPHQMRSKLERTVRLRNYNKLSLSSWRTVSSVFQKNSCYSYDTLQIEFSPEIFVKLNNYDCEQPISNIVVCQTLPKPDIPVVDLLTYDKFQKIPENCIRCENDGIYINYIAVCDGKDDCTMKNDEENCQNIKPFHFKCHSNDKVIHFSLVCNFMKDCSDGSDEEECEYDECSEFQVSCKNEQCVNSTFVCDSERHCFDTTDEICKNKNALVKDFEKG
ncbi:DgyrCDS9215 [Dimorphilus gyrociliatus]|uniref:DgyrCDS9215 n=1 Tax=Dimorphilus gyrociliatus TaxID=2664684 RepID=A0A7I8VXV4_9ANNE|nr:DgyrCDS9215 [Dimorphilus gyrociliatus]